MDATQLEAGVQTLSAANIVRTLPTSATIPPSTFSGGFRYNTAGFWLQSRPTTDATNAANVLLATLQNDTGAAATRMTISYDFSTNSWVTGGNTIGLYVYYSLSGTPGSWIAIPGLSGSEVAGPVTAEVELNGTWAQGSTLYLLWADDNSSTITDPSYMIDNFLLVANQGAVEPGIQLVTPANGLTVPQSYSINVTTLTQGAIDSVDFLVDGGVVASDTTSPFGFALDTTFMSVGSHTLRARANINGGGTVETTNRTFTLVANQPPVIEITNVYSGTVTGFTFLVGSPVTFQTGVRDDVSVTNVEWYVDSTLYVNHASNAATLIFIDTLVGAHSIYAVAVDNSGLRTTTPNVDITITNPPVYVTLLITNGSQWLYYDTNLSQGVNFPPPADTSFGTLQWTDYFYPATDWNPLYAEIGGGDATEYPEKSVIDIGPANGRYYAHYFRKSFFVDNAASIENLQINLLRDDGAIVYINGISVWTNNMGTTDLDLNNPAVIGYTNRANASEDGVTYQVFNIVGQSAIGSILQPGDNWIAVEVHQQNNTSSDTSFDLMLWAQGQIAPTVVITAPTNGTTVIEGSSINVTATAGVYVNSVRFDLDGIPQATDDTPPTPFTGTIANLPAGTHNITAYATDIFGANVTSLPVTINVVPDTLPVSVINATYSAGVTNGTYLVGSSLTNTFYVADDVSVTNVTCYLNGAFYFSPTNGIPTAARATNTITVFVNDALAGTNTFVVAAVDTRGNTNYSAPISVLVTNPPLALLLTNGSSWAYFNTTSAPPSDINGAYWFQPNYLATTWSNGLAPFGGRGAVNTKEATVLDLGPSTNRNVTAYFRKSINVSNPSAYSGLTLNILRDDGAIVYINGQPVWTNNITSLALENDIVSYTNLAVNAPGDNGTRYQTTTIGTSALVSGNNLVAVEMHQNSITSSDIVFDLMLWGQAPLSAPPINIENTGTQVRITWTGSAVLQQADALATPPAQSNFSDVPGNPTSPYVVPAGTVKFYRLRTP